MKNYTKVIFVSGGILLSTGITYFANDYYPPFTRYVQRQMIGQPESKPDMLQALIEGAILGAFGGVSASLIIENILEKSKKQ